MYLVALLLAGETRVSGAFRRASAPKMQLVQPNESECFCFKVARYSFPGPIPPKFEHKLRRHKQSFEKIATTVV